MVSGKTYNTNYYILHINETLLDITLITYANSLQVLAGQNASGFSNYKYSFPNYFDIKQIVNKALQGI